MIVLRHDLCVGMNHLFLPVEAKPLIVHEQNNTPKLWTVSNGVDPSAVARRFYVAHTDERLPVAFDEYEPYYIGSVFLSGGSLVYHVFEMN